MVSVDVRTRDDADVVLIDPAAFVAAHRKVSQEPAGR
jgi:hypothetical protein